MELRNFTEEEGHTLFQLSHHTAASPLGIENTRKYEIQATQIDKMRSMLFSCTGKAAPFFHTYHASSCVSHSQFESVNGHLVGVLTKELYHEQRRSLLSNLHERRGLC